MKRCGATMNGDTRMSELKGLQRTSREVQVFRRDPVVACQQSDPMHPHGALSSASAANYGMARLSA